MISVSNDRLGCLCTWRCDHMQGQRDGDQPERGIHSREAALSGPHGHHINTQSR